MLGRWLRRSNRLQHEDANMRLQAVLELSEEQVQAQQQQLLKLALSDRVVDVRKAALARVTQPNQLAILLDDDVVAEAAARQIARLIDRGMAAECQFHKQVVAARIAQANVDELPHLIKSIREPAQLAELAVKLRNRERELVLAHPALHNEAGLTLLERTARGRDKFCNRHARDKLEQIKQAKTRCADLLQRVQELDLSISKELKHQPQAAEALIAQRQKLAKLGEMRTTASADLSQAINLLEACGGPAEAYAVADDPLAGVDLFIPDPDNDPFAALLVTLQEMSHAMRLGSDINHIRQQRDELAERWLSHADKFPPTSAQHAVFEQVSSQYQKYQQAWQRYRECDWQALVTPPGHDDVKACHKWQKQCQQQLKLLRWPTDHQAPEQVQQLQQLLAEMDDQLNLRADELTTIRQQLSDNLSAAHKALEEGHLDAATQQLRQARQLHKQAADKDKSTDQTLHTLSAKLSELRDWQKFATTPKRLTLIEQLQTICSVPRQPPDQAAELKLLRQQWQQLGRPISAEDIQLQQQFDVLAEQAYEPCRAYYEQQQQTRADNLAQRQAICEQLQTYLDTTDWDNAEIKAAESILRTARETWRSYHPCDRQALKPVQLHFEQLQDQLHGHIKASWDKNVNIKKDLCARAVALLEQPLAEQIAGAKQLQQEWRSVGPTPRGIDQRLWREFRQTCDKVFAQREADQEAASAHQQLQREQLAKAIEALEALTQTTAESASPRLLQDANNAIEALTGEIRMDNSQRQRVSQANRQYQLLLAQARQDQLRAQIDQWQQWDIQVSAQEAQQETQQAADTTADPDSTNPQAPPALFAKRLAGQAQREDWLQLTLTAEIAADMASPAENQSQRMALQVELMNAGIRQFSEQDCQELLQRWCAAGPKDSDAEALRDRFFAAITARQMSEAQT